MLKNEQLIPGGNVLVVGGGMVGCEVCEHLLHNKRGPLHITMIEMTDEIAAGMVVNEKVLVMDRLHKATGTATDQYQAGGCGSGIVKLNVHGERWSDRISHMCVCDRFPLAIRHWPVH